MMAKCVRTLETLEILDSLDSSESRAYGVPSGSVFEISIFLTSCTCFFEVFLPELELDLKTC